jgi:hypothetical protein
MESKTSVESPPAQALIMQMVMGAWVTKVISEVTRLAVPDLVKQRGSMSAAEMVSIGGIHAAPSALERVLRACASLGVFTEEATGKFGPTQLSDVLTSDSPVSVKKLVEAMGGPWYRGWAELLEAVKTGEPQARRVFGLEWWVCRLILRDEAGHIAFHRDRMARVGRGRAWRYGWWWGTGFRLLGLGAATMLWVNHAPALKALGASTPEYYIEVWRGISGFLRLLRRDSAALAHPTTVHHDPTVVARVGRTV